jgi:hypothetical protein
MSKNNSALDHKRMVIVMTCFDKLPYEMRDWISNLHFSLHDDHILRGYKEVLMCKEWVESGKQINYYAGNGQN